VESLVEIDGNLISGDFRQMDEVSNVLPSFRLPRTLKKGIFFEILGFEFILPN
jgi:hypothetical protein